MYVCGLSIVSIDLPYVYPTRIQNAKIQFHVTYRTKSEAGVKRMPGS